MRGGFAGSMYRPSVGVYRMEGQPDFAACVSSESSAQDAGPLDVTGPRARPHTGISRTDSRTRAGVPGAVASARSGVPRAPSRAPLRSSTLRRRLFIRRRLRASTLPPQFPLDPGDIKKNVFPKSTNRDPPMERVS